MAFKLLDGTTAAVDFAVTLSGTNSSSLKCLANYVSCDIAREMFERTTFCTSSGWRSRVPGMKQLVGHIAGFLSSGSAISDPLAMMASTASLAFVFTIDTGCTFTGNLHDIHEHLGMRANADSERGIDFESDGPVTSAWVVV